MLKNLNMDLSWKGLASQLIASNANGFKLAIAFCLGLTLPLSFAPFDYWPVAILSLIGFQALVTGLPAKAGFKVGWSYGFGVFAAGASWVYVSIHEYGFAPVPLALLLTFLFTFLLGLFFALQTYTFNRWFDFSDYRNLLTFPAIWILFEWFRSWFLTGFPWLYLGYGHIETWLAGWAPVFGVFGIGFITVLTASSLLLCIKSAIQNPSVKKQGLPLLVCLLLWGSGLLLTNVQWTTSKEEISVTLMQGNIPQEKKWLNEYRPVSLKTYRELNRNVHSDLIIWPETAIPYFKHQVPDWLEETEQLLQPDQGLITGIPYLRPDSKRSNPILHNSIIGMGQATGMYHKQKLVPFGEYVPMQDILRGLIQFFNLPMSNFRPGPAHQEPIKFRDSLFWPAICYEIAYPSFIAENIGNDHPSNVILTISNDAWFGDSLGPKQHLQLAQMRALENSRYVLRATNTGLTAVINEKGIIENDMPAFIAGGLSARIAPQQGLTPYSQWTDKPILALVLLSLLAAKLLGRVPSSINNQQTNQLQS
ncbi:apolipoprotein N-acyltransferase [Litoribacillus peritrichatus]|uniref:apolipoprotein N-acyltransferase n=1 Tax=Litoribacillus peritrichatus TaxID=718191 RepID=UPI0031DE0B6A